MAEGFLKFFDSSLSVYSAGTEPAIQVHSRTFQVMKEAGVNLNNNKPKNVDQFLNESFDYVITVCNHARETCPAFTGQVKRRLHFGFDDPVKATGSEEEVLNVFRRVRDEIRSKFHKFYIDHLMEL
ncbi:MAG: arsenate reductase ArsC [Calditrichaceae bacterium]|nr:arsenate reductase ArsC [Calditrichaceae bacterium]MBN2710739.1 arsenate reductase ArsC [Calditrichaceae bacterium]RQV95717.1 MAG: arsenate reductase ArsC [Calditrichota bacterium]